MHVLAHATLHVENISRQHFKIFFLFVQENRAWYFMWTVSEETIHMNCQSLIFGDNKKKIFICPLLKLHSVSKNLNFPMKCTLWVLTRAAPPHVSPTTGIRVFEAYTLGAVPIRVPIHTRPSTTADRIIGFIAKTYIRFISFAGWMFTVIIIYKSLSSRHGSCFCGLVRTSSYSSQLSSGPSCSKLTTSLVNDSLKFTSGDTQISWNFLQKISEYRILNPLKQLTKWPLTSSLS